MIPRKLSLANIRELFRERRVRHRLLPSCSNTSLYRSIVLLLLVAILLLVASLHADRAWKRRLERDSRWAGVVSHVEWNYGAVIDAGSSGSRIFLYRWPKHSGDPDDLLKIHQMRDSTGEALVKRVEPGLSSYGDDSFGAFESIQTLLDYASVRIPKARQKESLLFLMATGGLRLLPRDTQRNLLDGLGRLIRAKYPFQFPPSHTEVLTGKLEGIYEWVAVNYILGRFNHTAHKTERPSWPPSNHRRPTVASLELGGASAQITYEISNPAGVPKDLVAYVNLGCDAHSTEHSYTLYSSTLSTFGSNMAMQRYYAHLASRAKDAEDSVTIFDPCLLRQMREQKDVVVVGGGGKRRTVRLYLIGSGNYTMCRERLEPLLNVSAPCSRPPCSASGIHQPVWSAETREFYGVSEYWYTTHETLRMGGRYAPEKFDWAAKTYCQTRWSDIQFRHRSGRYPTASQTRLRNQCFKSAWMSLLLHAVYRFPRTPQSAFRFTTVSDVNGTSVQWTLGALIFKTKYLPLREVQQRRQQHANAQTRKAKASLRNDVNPRLSVVLVVAAVVALLLWMFYRRSRLKSVRSVESPLRRVRSAYPFFVLGDDDAV